ncbi:MAG: DUF202 domain-containing protein [Nocardioidaceae bacterium]|nr:MAG: DUF202 domain-containing protein [Nocardioidaceae bacterium]
MAGTNDLLANERTFLAYVRTALAFQVAGLGVFQFLDVGHEVLRRVLGLLLVAIGSYVALMGWLQYRANDRSLRTGGEVIRPRSAAVIGLTVMAIPAAAALVLLLT